MHRDLFEENLEYKFIKILFKNNDLQAFLIKLIEGGDELARPMQDSHAQAVCMRQARGGFKQMEPASPGLKL